MGKVGLVIFPLLVAVSTFGANILTLYVSSRLFTIESLCALLSYLSMLSVKH